MSDQVETKSVTEIASISSDQTIVAGNSTPSTIASVGSDDDRKSGLSESATPVTEGSGPEKSDTNDQKGENTTAAAEKPAEEGDPDEKAKKKIKPRVLRENIQGIYSVKELEGANFFMEWFKGVRASMPYMVKLSKTYWSLSPTRASLLIIVNIWKAVLPSFDLWVDKQFLDEVQRAAEGGAAEPKKLFGLVCLRLFTRFLRQGIAYTQDKIDGVMDRRLGSLLDSQLIEAYLRLDPDQLTSRKVDRPFNKAKSFAYRDPSRLVTRWIAILRYVLTIVSSSYTLSRLMSSKASQLLLLNGIRLVANILHLVHEYSGAIRYQIVNKAWHRLNLMKTFSLNSDLRSDISVTGLEDWLMSEMTKANTELGDMTTRPPWYRRTSTNSGFMRYIVLNLVNSFEYVWLVYNGFKKGISLGTLHLIRSSATEIVDSLWDLMCITDNATDEWKNLLAFYHCLNIKSEMDVIADPVKYVGHPSGMKIEARNIRYKYDIKKDEEVLKGASFVINPGEMIAVVGFNGAGKSTLAKLLTRLANVTEGELLVNDVDVKQYDPTELRRHIAVLFQEIGHYRGLTILENIGVGKIAEVNSRNVVEQSAVDADAAEFIEKLPHKYDSYLGFRPGQDVYGWGVGRWDDSDSDSDDDEEEPDEKGRVQKDISGGQWQKIALARAFMRGHEADLLVLDEPTANLDPEAEHKLFETIKRLRKGKTTVYISHRFNTVRAADRIMVLENGEVKEFGTHEELLTLKDGRYHRLYTLQAKGFTLDEKGKVTKDVDGMCVSVKEDVVQTIIETEK